MDKAIDHYRKCLKEYQEAAKMAVVIKANITRTRNDLRLAKAELREMEAEILDDHLRDL